MKKSNGINLSGLETKNLDTQISPDKPLIINPEGKSHLITTAKWVHFITIVGFVIIILMLLIGVATMALSTVVNEYRDFQVFQYFPMSMIAIGVSHTLTAVIAFFPIHYLYKFTRKIKLGMAFNNQDHISEAFRNLKKTAKFSGIVTIVYLALMLLIIPVLILSAGLLRNLVGGIPIM